MFYEYDVPKILHNDILHSIPAPKIGSTYFFLTQFLYLYFFINYFLLHIFTSISCPFILLYHSRTVPFYLHFFVFLIFSSLSIFSFFSLLCPYLVTTCYLYTSCLSSGISILHLLYLLIAPKNAITSFTMQFVFGNASASLYFHILYLINMFTIM